MDMLLGLRFNVVDVLCLDVLVHKASSSKTTVDLQKGKRNAAV